MDDINDLTEKIKNFPRPTNLRPSAPRPKEDVCPICDGVGYIKRSPVSVPVGHPDFGKIDPCVCISTNVFQSISNLTMGEVERHNWGMIMDKGKALAASREVQKVIDRGYGWIYLYGEPGVGKTMLLKIAVAEMVKAKRQAIYVNMSALIDNLREAYDTEYPQAQAVTRLARWTRIPFLAIDEFDKVKDTEYVNERRMRLVDDRYKDACEEKTITLFASNSPPSAFDDYIADRFNDGRFRVINMGSDSMRPIQFWEDKNE